MVYVEPKSIDVISQELYNYRNPLVSKWVNELYNDEKIEIKLKGNYRYCQTKPETILEYIYKKLKDKSIKLTAPDRKKLLNYLKSSHFKEFINNFAIYMDNKSEYYTFNGLMEWFGIRIIHELKVASYIKEKGIADLFSSEIPQEASELDLIRIFGFDLGAKVANVHNRARMINLHLNTFIRTIEFCNQRVIKKLEEKIKNLELEDSK